jgi:predicted HTH transcriptional regulator
VLGRGKGGRMTRAALAEELEIAEGTIGRTLRRLQEKGVAHKVGEVEGKAVWCLTERTEGEL